MGVPSWEKQSSNIHLAVQLWDSLIVSVADGTHFGDVVVVWICLSRNGLSNVNFVGKVR